MAGRGVLPAGRPVPGLRATQGLVRGVVARCDACRVRSGRAPRTPASSNSTCRRFRVRHAPTSAAGPPGARAAQPRPGPRRRRHGEAGRLLRPDPGYIRRASTGPRTGTLGTCRGIGRQPALRRQPRGPVPRHSTPDPSPPRTSSRQDGSASPSDRGHPAADADRRQRGARRRDRSTERSARRRREVASRDRSRPRACRHRPAITWPRTQCSSFGTRSSTRTPASATGSRTGQEQGTPPTFRMLTMADLRPPGLRQRRPPGPVHNCRSRWHRAERPRSCPGACSGQALPAVTAPPAMPVAASAGPPTEGGISARAS